MTALMEPLLIVVMAVVIGAVVIAIALPMFSMFDT
jgi:type IV pilus assembly protein PilC